MCVSTMKSFRFPAAHTLPHRDFAVFRVTIAVAAVLAALTLPVVASAQYPTLTGAPPTVYGHRGACGYRPEHTLASYQLAIELGADYIEPDLVSTRDGVLICRHEPVLGVLNGEYTTDVANHPEFADRVRTRTLDGTTITGWWAQDFTLAEIKTLFARERLPAIRPANAQFDFQFRIPTFQEALTLAQTQSAALGRAIGIIPETKHPTYHNSFGLNLEAPLVATLQANGLANAGLRVLIQSFEVSNLQRLSSRPDLHVGFVQLIDSSGKPFDFVVSGDPRTYSDLITPTGLAAIKTYADVVSPNKTRVITSFANGPSGTVTNLVGDAHRVGLLVVPYTFRRENFFLPDIFDSDSDPTHAGDLGGEIKAYVAAGVDGFFTDNSDYGRAVVPEAAVQPSITGFSPASGAPGTPIIITGNNFLGATAVAFARNVVTTGVTVASNTQLVVTVPAGARTGVVTVRTGTGSNTSPTKFQVLP